MNYPLTYSTWNNKENSYIKSCKIKFTQWVKSLRDLKKNLQKN